MNANRPCILVLSSTYPRWVGDKEPPFVYELCKRLSDAFEIVVLVPHSPSAKKEEIWDGIKIYRYSYFFESWQTLAYNGGILSNLKKNRFNLLLVPFFLCAQLLAVIRILKTHPISLIHAHWIFPQGLVGLIGTMLSGHGKVPVICTSHGGDLFGLRGFLFSAIKRWVIQRSAALTVVSNAMKDIVITNFGVNQAHSIHVIPMGVDLSATFTPNPLAPRMPYELLFVGRLVEKKGVNYLIHAMPHVLKHFPRTHLTIAGAGPEYSNLLQLIDQLQLEDNISLIGAIHNTRLSTLYREATIFVAPYVEGRDGDQEGLGLVMVEALGCGCPVIASDMPAVKDVIIDGETGMLAQQRNPEDIANKVIALLGSPALRGQLTANGRKYILDKFDWNLIAERYQVLLDEVRQEVTID